MQGALLGWPTWEPGPSTSVRASESESDQRKSISTVRLHEVDEGIHGTMDDRTTCTRNDARQTRDTVEYRIYMRQGARTCRRRSPGPSDTCTGPIRLSVPSSRVWRRFPQQLLRAISSGTLCQIPLPVFAGTAGCALRYNDQCALYHNCAHCATPSF